MPTYTAPVQDYMFLLRDVIGEDVLTQYDSTSEATLDVVEAILEETGKFCTNELAPLNQIGDEVGCTLDNGNVTLPDGFKEAYNTYREGGWSTFLCNPEYGGQGLPQYLTVPMAEMMGAANLSFNITTGLTLGAIEAIEAFGDDALKQKFVPNMVAGEWSGTMCLTEAHCGTDLGIMKTKAEPQADGSYKITGTKIFISAGDQNLTDNIIHLVLAKLPDAPKGSRGISLFVVPKFMVNDDGSLGDRNAAVCGSVEHKMGIKASPTCVMNFDGATGYLVGKPNLGLNAMFVMMNAARLVVGAHGISLAEVAYENAVAYAKDRLQGRNLAGTKQPEKAADPILEHPDIKRLLLDIKAFTEPARLLALKAAFALDQQEHEKDAEKKQDATSFLMLITPIIKAFFSDLGFDSTNKAMQVFGGHGYVKEWGMEQFVRDARIGQIYEGANGVQALDLVGRKMGMDFGRNLRSFFHPAQKFVDDYKDHPELKEIVEPFGKILDKLQKATMLLAQRGMKNPLEAGAGSTPYLHMFGYTALAYMWCLMAKSSMEKLASGTASNPAFYKRKLKLAHYYFAKVLPIAGSHFISLLSGYKPIEAFDDADFDVAA